MGCLCSCIDIPQEMEDLSQVGMSEKGEQNILVSGKYREQGKKYFHNKEYQKAVLSYSEALNYDLNNFINFTNLALAQKALNRLDQSIKTIQKMEQNNRIKITQGNKAYLVKGKIIKARCQTIYAKNLIQSIENMTKQDQNKAKKLIQSAVNSLSQLNSRKDLRQVSNQFNIQKYLKNAQKIKSVILELGSLTFSEDPFLKYLTKQIKTNQGLTKFKSMEISNYYSNPNHIVQQIQNHQKKEIRKRFYDEQEQQFVIDPISYQRFNSPILVKSGFTYEEQILKSHYKKNGSYDPITRQPFNQELGVKNNTLQAYISQSKKHFNFMNELQLLNL